MSAPPYRNCAAICGALLASASANALELRAALPSGGAVTCEFVTAEHSAIGIMLTCSGAPAIPDTAIVAALTGKVVYLEGADGEPQELTLGEGGFTLAPAPVREIPGTRNEPPVANADEADAPAGGAVVTIPVLQNDTDPELDFLTVNVLEPVGTPLGTAAVAVDSRSVQYTPPADIGTETAIIDRFQYQAADNHGGISDWANIAVTVKSAPPPPPPDACHPATGGDCLGQRADGQWVTLEQEMAGLVTGNLYIPNIESPKVVVYDRLGRESYWGCGPRPAAAVRPVGNCNYKYSLERDLTYVARFPLNAGQIPGASIVIKSDNLDAHFSYLFAVSTSPAELINGQSDGSPRCEVVAPVAGVTFSGPIRLGTRLLSAGCELLDRTATYTGRNHLYVKFKAVDAGGTDECSTGKPCRLYLNAW
jgi:hypothetical protein